MHTIIRAAERVGVITADEGQMCHRDIRGTRESIVAYGLAQYTAGRAGYASGQQYKKKKDADLGSGERPGAVHAVVDESDRPENTAGTTSRSKRHGKRTRSQI